MRGAAARVVAALLVIQALGVPADGARPRAARPELRVGDRWVLTGGTYELTRIENDRYVFTASASRIDVTKDLAVTRIARDARC